MKRDLLYSVSAFQRRRWLEGLRGASCNFATEQM